MLSYPEIDPVAIDLGVLQVRWYGISYVVGILLAWWLLKLRANNKHSGWTDEQVADLIFYGMIGVIVGGRLGSVLFYNLPYYLESPLAVLKVWQGGMSFHGGFLGVLVAICLYSRKINKAFFSISDFLMPVVPIGLGSGRLANFFNGELWGRPTELPWAMIFPDSRAGGIPRHPSQLYEALLEGVVMFIVLWWFSASSKPVKAVTGMFLLLYAIFRTAVEFVREPDAHIGYIYGEWLTMGQVLSFPMAVFGVIFLVMAYRNNVKCEA